MLYKNAKSVLLKLKKNLARPSPPRRTPAPAHGSFFFAGKNGGAEIWTNWRRRGVGGEGEGAAWGVGRLGRGEGGGRRLGGGRGGEIRLLSMEKGT
jgi:hypothetical protein